MAKKKENELTYLQMPLPVATREKTTVRVNWSGLNKRQTLDTGELSYEKNISTLEAPYLTPSPMRRDLYTLGIGGGEPLGMWGFDDFLVVVYSTSDSEDSTSVNVDYIKNIDSEDKREFATGRITETASASEPRCLTALNVFDISDGTVSTTEYSKEILIFPDRKIMKFYQETGVDENGKKKKLDIKELGIEGSPVPHIVYATTHNSRIYGVGYGSDENGNRGEHLNRIFVSNFNNPVWKLDTPDEYNESNAWESPAGSNIRASGEFTGITTFMNSVVAFKDDYMHEIIGKSNPFRINDIYAEGAVDNRTIVEVDGNLFFVSDDAVKVYTGGNPRIMSYKLGVNQFNKPVAGTDGRRYFLYCRDENNDKHIFVYDTIVMQWAEEYIDNDTTDVVAFAKNKDGFYMVSTDGHIERIDTDEYDGQEWAIETDLSLGRTIDVKHIQQVKILADVAPLSTVKAYLLRNGEAYDENIEDAADAEDVKKYGKILPIFSYINDWDVQKTVPLRVSPRLSAHWGTKLRISGTGFCRIYQMEITLKGGGKLFAREMFAEEMYEKGEMVDARRT